MKSEGAMVAAISPHARLGRGVRGLIGNRLFVLTTFIPTLFASIYFGFIASDVYISESRFVVRSPERQSASPLGLILKGAGFSRSQDDSYTVQDFIRSRDALETLSDMLQIRDAFSSPNIDIFSRFPGLDFDDSFEALHLYYQKKVGVQVDAVSSITTLTVRAFTAKDAYAINKRLLELAEELVNKLNTRGRQDLIRFAAEEVAIAEKSAKAAGLSLASYRNQEGVIDPERQTTIPLQQIAKLQENLIATKSQIAQVERLAKNNPQLPVLRQQASLLEQEILVGTREIAGADDRSLATKAAEYQRLALEKELADKMLASAMSSLEQARNDAQRKQLYLERIVQPNVPDEAMEPRRIRAVMMVFMLGIISWGVLAMLVAGIKEHQD